MLNLNGQKLGGFSCLDLTGEAKTLVARGLACWPLPPRRCSFPPSEQGFLPNDMLAFERQPGAMEISVEKIGVEYKVRDMS